MTDARTTLTTFAIPVVLALACAPCLADETRARELAAASTGALEDDPALALLLAREALAAADVEPARTALYAALQEYRHCTVLRGHEAPVIHCAVSPDGTVLATASEDGTARLWSPAGEPLATLAPEHAVTEVHFVGSGDRLLTVTPESLALWSRAGERLAKWEAAPFAIVAGGLLVGSVPGTVRYFDADGEEVEEVEAIGAGPATGEHAFWVVTDRGRAQWYDTRGRRETIRPAKGTSEVTWSRDGTRVATWGEGPAVELWTSEGKRVAELRHGARVERVALSDRGDRVVTASEDGYFAFWTGEGERTHRVRKTGPCTYLTISSVAAGPVVTLEDGNRITLWWEDGARGPSERIGDEVRRVEASPCGHGLLVETADGTRRYLHRGLGEVAVHENLPGELVFARWGGASRWQLLADDRGGIALQHWGLTYPLHLGKHDAAVRHACFAPGDHAVLTASDDGTARLWEIDAPELPVVHNVNGLAMAGLSPDDRYLFALSYVRLHVHTRDGERRWWVDVPGFLQGYAIGERLVVSGDGENAARMYDWDGKLVARLEHDSVVTGVFGDWTGKRYATSGYEETGLKLWDERGRLRGELDHPARVGCAAFLPDGQVITGAEDRVGRIWSRHGRLREEFQVPGGNWWCMPAARGGRFATASVEAAGIQIRNEDGEATVRLQGLPGPATMMQFSWEGDLFFAGFGDGTARLWTVEGEPVADLPHSSEIRSAWFLPDDSGLATACDDGSVRHWDRDGALRAVLPGHRCASPEILFTVISTNDGSWVVTAGEDGFARQWPLDRDELLRIAAERAPRELTDGERATFGLPGADAAPK